MTKNGRIPSRSNKTSVRKEPYRRMTKNLNKELENIKCPICMEHPHNAVLLVCSNHEKGCRTFMCNGPCQFNCSDQYCATPATGDLTCPLCRGHVIEVRVVDRVREYMDSKVRSCENQACEFSGTWEELKCHWWDRHYDDEEARIEKELREKREWEMKKYEWVFQDLIGYAIEAVPVQEPNPIQEAPIQEVDIFNYELHYNENLWEYIIGERIREAPIQEVNIFNYELNYNENLWENIIGERIREYPDAANDLDELL